MVGKPGNALGVKRGTPWNKGMKFPEKSRENHHNWRGGVSSIKHLMRGSPEWRTWRKQIFERDDYRCIDCGERGVFLEPHHIEPLKKTLSRAFDTRNGITLCRPCHKMTMGKELQLMRNYFSLIPAQM